MKVHSFKKLRAACGLPPEIQPRIKAQPISKLEQVMAAESRDVPTEVERLNKLESRWHEVLLSRERQGLISKVRVQHYKLRLGHRTFYTPDFSFYDQKGRLVFHETKGFMRDDAAVKIKTAAREYLEHDFWIVREVAGEWEEILVKK